MPTSDDTIELALATPKEMLVRHARCRLQCFEDEIRQDYVHRLTRFLHVEKETAAGDAVCRQLDGIALFVAQCDHRIDTHGVARRNPTRQNRDAS